MGGNAVAFVHIGAGAWEGTMMRRYIGVMCCAIFVGWIAVPAVAQAPHKTVKECDAEWKADKANLQAAGHPVCVDRV